MKNKDFNNWLFNRGYNDVEVNSHQSIHITDYFSDLPLAAQFGIYQDYFAEIHNIYISTELFILYKTGEILFLNNVCEKRPYEDGYGGGFMVYSLIKEEKHKNLNEARKTAIEKAFEIVEQKKVKA